MDKTWTVTEKLATSQVLYRIYDYVATEIDLRSILEEPKVEIKPTLEETEIETDYLGPTVMFDKKVYLQNLMWQDPRAQMDRDFPKAVTIYVDYSNEGYIATEVFHVGPKTDFPIIVTITPSMIVVAEKKVIDQQYSNAWSYTPVVTFTHIWTTFAPRLPDKAPVIKNWKTTQNWAHKFTGDPPDF